MTDPAWIETQSAFIVCTDGLTLTCTEYKEGIAILGMFVPNYEHTGVYHILLTEFSCTDMSIGYNFCTQIEGKGQRSCFHTHKGISFYPTGEMTTT